MTEDEFRKLLAEQVYEESRENKYPPESDGEPHTHEFSA